MKRPKLSYTLATFFIFAVVLAGCVGQKENHKETSSITQEDLLQAKWQDVLSQAEGQTVNVYLYGGSEATNRYIDDWVAPRLKKQTGIILNRVPVNDTKEIINKLLVEKQAGKRDGSVDVMWINGENFLTAKEKDLLWGSFVPELPNVQKYVDQESQVIKNDFGEPTEGMEAPWSQAQLVYTYNQNKMQQPPKSAEALKQWVKKHPGKFTYPAPPDFTGSAFIRNILYQTTGGYEQYLKSFDEQKGLDNKLEPFWDYLNAIEPYLWRKGQTYPESASKLDQLYANGAVWMTMSYDPAHAANEVKDGRFPESTRTFVFKEGTPSNTSYLSIPFNSPHKAAAMATINFMLSPNAQITKANPKIWGAQMAIDPNKLSEKHQKRLSALDLGKATLPAEVLAEHRVPEIPSDYVEYLEKGWLEHVAKD
ncbi:ABC transporter substrate-binding protein [Halobacillus naozhouensis]|uniref:ABC transporter substrate-binding protein n=1 Tax=Halobacillus naozhouensis TaxID=554880 RepID=A0ABY8IZ78_9BACI|nr:ABC transporter substrate-binding protein [Halobacillus naozhouensis]WFT74498.1 ABC transporter substrate-binding protein [Halobacillus naozhouensis]